MEFILKFTFYIVMINLLLVYPIVKKHHKGIERFVALILISVIGHFPLMIALIIIWIFTLLNNNFNVSDAINEINSWKKKDK